MCFDNLTITVEVDEDQLSKVAREQLEEMNRDSRYHRGDRRLR